MAQKQVHIAEIGPVVLQKRKGARSIRLTVGHDGNLRISMPHWTPYAAAEAFAISKLAWIKAQQDGKTSRLFGPDERIGKSHRLRFTISTSHTVTTRVTPTELIIRLPVGKTPMDKDVQSAVRASAVRALKQEAKKLLPGRLESMAARHGFDYRHVTIKHLKARWGSCSSTKDIALNCFLMQLPWELIDYVILHELVHTKIMAHGEKFWGELAKYVNDLPAKRKAIRAHQPTLMTVD
ncbi:MAG TPA: SprT family zinc-dependent metalloprotease [Candidatus Saccharimonadales bacterium]|nr:SprT family zinc-dependent metalloprotease [Candidatus Saccharimonadales bacterium]